LIRRWVHTRTLSPERSNVCNGSGAVVPVMPASRRRDRGTSVAVAFAGDPVTRGPVQDLVPDLSFWPEQSLAHD
jgi:hypothetical protein